MNICIIKKIVFNKIIPIFTSKKERIAKSHQNILTFK